MGANALYIEAGSPWDNGYLESCNAKLRDELLDREIFYTLREAQVLTLIRVNYFCRLGVNYFCRSDFLTV